MMKPGGEAILIVPHEIGYGEAGHPPVIPPEATLIFKVELLGIQPEQ
jgi:FKBP-type peptidyl-prolyl cis-trans isomerase